MLFYTDLYLKYCRNNTVRNCNNNGKFIKFLLSLKKYQKTICKVKKEYIAYFNFNFI